MTSGGRRTALWLLIIMGAGLASSFAIAAEISDNSALWLCRFLGSLLGAAVATIMLKHERSNLGVFGAAAVSFSTGMSAWGLVFKYVDWDRFDPADNWMAAFFAAAAAIAVWRFAFGQKGISGWLQRITGGKPDVE